MPFAILIIGLVLIVSAVRNSQGSLFSELAQDVPAFGIWAAAILAIGAIGFVPGLKPISRGLLFLVILVILVRDYKQIEEGLKGAWSNASSGTGPETSQTSAVSSGTSSGLEQGLIGALPGVGPAINAYNGFSSIIGSGTNG